MTGRGSRPGAARWLRDLRRAATWHRRLLVAGLLAASVAFAIQALSPAPPHTVAVLVAAKNLAGGTRLTPEDLRMKRLATSALPEGALRRRTMTAGRTLAAPVRKGEVLTDVRLVGRSFLDTYGVGMVAAPVRIADAAAVRLVQPGDVVDVLAAGGGSDGSATSVARLVAEAVPVVTTRPRPAARSAGPTWRTGARVPSWSSSPRRTRPPGWRRRQ